MFRELGEFRDASFDERFQILSGMIAEKTLKHWTNPHPITLGQADIDVVYNYIFLGTNKSSYIKVIRHAISTLAHHYEAIYRPEIDKNANKIDTDQGPPQQTNELSSTSTKMMKASFMTEVCTELAVTKNLATTDTFMCHDEGDIILSTFGFYSPSDSKHAGGVNLVCSALDGLSNYSRTTGRQSINVKNSTLSMREYSFSYCILSNSEDKI